jgi:hypothetical protein
MHPVLKRILIHGALTAAILALVGLLFAELASLWTTSRAGRPASAELNPPLPASFRYRVPLTLALGGFLFVAVGELVLRRIRGDKPAASAKPSSPQDDVEKLLNELLAQAEAKTAAEAAQKAAGATPAGGAPPAGVQKTEDREQKPENSQAAGNKKPQTGHDEEKTGGRR